MGTIQAKLLAHLLPAELVRLAAVKDDPELSQAAATALDARFGARLLSAAGRDRAYADAFGWERYA